MMIQSQHITPARHMRLFELIRQFHVAEAAHRALRGDDDADPLVAQDIQYDAIRSLTKPDPLMSPVEKPTRRAR